MSEVRTITLCLHRGTSAIGTAIRWFTRGEYSHASLILPGGKHIEAREFKGVIEHAQFTAAKGEEVDFFEIYVTDEQLEVIEQQHARELGAPYDYLMVLRFLSRRGPTQASATKWFCSEYIYALLWAAGVELFRATQPWEVCPTLLGRAPRPKYIRTQKAA